MADVSQLLDQLHSKFNNHNQFIEFFKDAIGPKILNFKFKKDLPTQILDKHLFSNMIFLLSSTQIVKNYADEDVIRFFLNTIDYFKLQPFSHHFDFMETLSYKNKNQTLNFLREKIIGEKDKSEEIIQKELLKKYIIPYSEPSKILYSYSLQLSDLNETCCNTFGYVDRYPD
jgi:hypothetical protein